MVETSTGNPFADLLLDMARAWMPVGIAAPDRLTQSILPGWSLISVNETHSSAPDTERAIVAKASYGRQIGRLLDAVEELVKERPATAPGKEAFRKLDALATEVKDTKTQAAKARLDQLRADLAWLKQNDEPEYDRQRAAFKAAFG